MARTARPRSQAKKKIPLNQGLLILLGICLVLYLLMALEGELPGLDGTDAPVGPSNAVSDCQVHFIDVGQGDSILIRSDGYTALIDAGENDQGKTVTDYLRGQGITKIDYLLMTHPHSDHIGGMDTVIKEFEIGKVIMPRLPDSMTPTTRTYTEVLEAIMDRDLKITPSRVGNSYELGQGVERDPAQAVEWYGRARENDYPPAVCALGLCYEVGRGVEEDKERAVELYREAAELGLDDMHAFTPQIDILAALHEKGTQRMFMN